MSSTTTESTTEATTQAAEEIRQVMADLYDAFATGNAEPWVSRLPDAHTPTGFGTDPDEFWSGPEQLAAVTRAQTSEMSAAGFSMRSGTPIIDVVGDVAWVVDQPTLHPDANTGIPLRLTCVFAAQGGEWQIRHFHLSVGVPNEAMLATTLTV